MGYETLEFSTIIVERQLFLVMETYYETSS